MRLGLATVLIVGCGFEVSSTPSDAPDGPPPDSGPCQAVADTCGDEVTLNRCTVIDQLPTPTTCAWRCVSGPPAHCADLVPTGGGVAPTDLDLGVASVVLTDATVDGDGTVTGNTGTLTYRVANGIAVFSATELRIAGTLTLTGSRPIAFAARGVIIINGAVDAQGTCVNNAPGPGGFLGGPYRMNGMGMGGGVGAPGSTTEGGGGAGHGAIGGAGGDGSATGRAGGVAYGDPSIPLLVGGSGGGGGGGGGGNDGVGFGGGGGGAIQFASNTSIAISAMGSINAGGCGGNGSNNAGNDGAGGGGAGGTIVLEAPVVTIAGPIAVNGGGGGAAKDDPGDDGALTRTAAAGGNDTTDGGPGGYALGLGGSPGQNGGAGGGGGGAVGRIRINTATGTAAAPSNLMSPALDDSPTTATAAVATTR